MLKISVVVPCVPNHIQHLERMIESYNNGTILPDEMLICLSSARKDASDKQYRLVEQAKFPTRFINVDHEAGPGENRQRGNRVASGDIIVYQDADDLAHPQRLEILKHVYEKYDAWHVSHFWVPFNSGFVNYDLDDLKVSRVRNTDSTRSKPYGCEFGNVTAGATSISRKIANSINWGVAGEWGEDWWFNINCLTAFDKSFVVHAGIYAYSKFQA